MKIKKTQKTDWDKAIRTNDVATLRRVNAELYENEGATMSYLRALARICASIKHPRNLPDFQSELTRIAREKFLTLSDDRKEFFLGELIGDEAIGNPEGEMILLLLGLFPREEDSFKTFEFLRRLVNKNRLNVKPKETTARLGMEVALTLMDLTAHSFSLSWTHAVSRMRTSDNLQVIRCFIEDLIMGTPTKVRVLPLPAWRPLDHVHHIQDGVQTLFLPASVEDERWLRRRVDAILCEIETRQSGMMQLVMDMRGRTDTYASQYETMWLEMMLEPKWALRADWLDAVAIEVPELVATGYSILRLSPLDEFPDFQARLDREVLDGTRTVLEYNFTPGFLTAISDVKPSESNDILKWVGRLLSFVIVQAVWTIVTGRSQKSETTGSIRASQSSGAVVRPQFRRLPDGFQASPEARARAMERFSKEPPPGFTFVREYLRGAESHSGEPLFAILKLQV